MLNSFETFKKKKLTAPESKPDVGSESPLRLHFLLVRQGIGFFGLQKVVEAILDASLRDIHSSALSFCSLSMTSGPGSWAGPPNVGSPPPEATKMHDL